MTTQRLLRQHFGGAPFARSEALAMGFTKRELDGPDLQRPYRGVRAFEVPATLHDRCRAYAVKMHSERAFTGATAATLRGWPIPRRLRQRTEIDVAGPLTSDRAREAGVRFTRVTDARLQSTVIDGLRVVSAELVLLNLARQCTSDELVVLGDAAIASSKWYPGLVERPSTSLERIESFLENSRRSAGANNLRRTLERLRPGVESPMETQTRLVILAAGLPEPEVAGEIWEGGVKIATCDLVFRVARVAVEYEGEYHRAPDVWEGDIERVRRLERHGWKVLRVTKRGLFPSSARFVDDLRAALRDRSVLAA